MRKLTPGETWNILEYEKVRDEFRREIIALKKIRRVEVGEHITLVFENRATVLFQIQEMVRAERMVTEAAIAREVEVYNSLIPDDGELSATLFIEYERRSTLHPALSRLVGLEQHVTLHIGDRFVVPARFEAGRSRADSISAVQYLRFCLAPEQQAALAEAADIAGRGDPARTVRLVVDHPSYQAAQALIPATVAALVGDLA